MIAWMYQIINIGITDYTMKITLEINCIDNGSIYNGEVDDQETECLDDCETLLIVYYCICV